MGGLSIQAFHIMDKIAQVDTWITPQRQETVFEAHPELAFARLAGQAMRHNKKKPEGQEERMAAIAPFFPDVAAWAAEKPFPRKAVALDDLLDACVLTRVALAYHQGSAVCLPPDRPKDARGLDMVIWAPPED